MLQPHRSRPTGLPIPEGLRQRTDKNQNNQDAGAPASILFSFYFSPLLPGAISSLFGTIRGTANFHALHHCLNAPRNEPQTCALRLGNSEYYQHETARRSSEGLAMNNKVRIQNLE